MDMLLKRLDESERNVHHMIEKGTLIAVKQDQLLENLQEQKVIMSDIVNHQTAFDAATSQASLLIQSSEPQEACQLQADLDSINERYTKLDTRTKDHGIYLENLSRRLSNFEAELENLEHWLLPSGHELDSNQIPQLPLIEFVNNWRVMASPEREQQYSLETVSARRKLTDKYCYWVE
ncbi:dystonin-like [Strongylocentrotus purpuratus]|uniref:Uncharacterized protein n=1 Tax=Strongylocentrotus purpuratus TaxID=7668 RepID=A0A7M7NH96_STRPU|nr:dystonin-like [Strongylocentrotus purpuratus]